jgi:D-apionolactonase
MNAATAMLYYGTTQSVPETRQLTAGPWTVSLIDGALHTIRYQDVEVIRAVAFLVRDKDWGTCRPTVKGIEIDEAQDGFRVSYRAQCVNPDGDTLGYALSIDCAAQGALTLCASAVANTAFLTARCGFCVLHPIDGVAGAPARVEHSDGTVEHAPFPTLIDPWQPFKDIRSIEHDLSATTPGLPMTVRCAFTGDVFEMEDQRNWSDASFKTYSRPLEWPWPYTLEAGATVEQSVTLSVDAKAARAGEVPESQEMRKARATQATRATQAARSAQAARQPSDTHAKTVTIDLAAQSDGNDETMPALGIALAANEAETALAHLALLAELGPQQLTFSFDPPAGHGVRELERFAALQRASGIPAVLEFALPGIGEPRAEIETVAAQIDAAGLALAGIVVSPSVHRQSNPPGSISPPCPALDEVYREARRVFGSLRLGGGMLSYFTELNRKRPPLELVDWVTHATCPIVHAADDRSVMQTLEAIPHITRSCRALIGAQPYAIGPVSIGMRQNPYGSRVMPNPRDERIAMAERDPRQRALFGAAWLVGYAAALAGAKVETFTLGALTGARGLADFVAAMGANEASDKSDADGANGTHGTTDEANVTNGADGLRLYPAFHVARALAQMAGATRLHCTLESRDLACIASRDVKGRMHLLLANLADTARTVTLDTGVKQTAMWFATRIDEHSAREIETAPIATQPISLSQPVALPPFACLIATSEATQTSETSKASK